MPFRALNAFSRWEWLGLAALALALVAGALPIWRFTVDDSFISFRYADHLLHGQGPSWNPGEASHTEGYTSILWVLLSALFILLGGEGSPHLAAKVAGLLMGFALCALFVWTARRQFPRAPAAASFLVLFAFLLAELPFSSHLMSGMETPLFCLCLFALFSQALLEAPRPALFALTGLAAALARPEGAVIFVLYLAHVVRSLPPERRKPLLKAAGLYFLLPGAAYLAWKAGYFGNLLPNTFYVKNHHSPSTAATSWMFLFSYQVPFALALASLGFFRSLRRPAALFLLAALPLAGYLFTDHVMGFSFRYYFPAIPLLLFLLVPLVGALTARAARSPLSPAAAGLAVLLAGVTVLNIQSRINDTPYTKVVADTTDGYARLGRALRPFAGLGRTLLLSEAGAIPYFSGWKVEDFGKLNSRLFTRGTQGEIDAWLKADPPAAICLVVKGDPEKAKQPFAAAFSQRPYSLARTIPLPSASSLQLFLDSSLPEFDEIWAALGDLEKRYKGT